MRQIRYFRHNNNIFGHSAEVLLPQIPWAFSTYIDDQVCVSYVTVQDHGEIPGHIYFRGPRWLCDYFSLGVFIIH